MQGNPSVTLLCYDGHESSKHAMAVAGAALGHTGKLVLLHIWDTPADSATDSYSESRVASKSHQELEADELASARAVAEEGVQFARAAGFDAVMELRPAHRDEWRVILEVADALDAALIVLGTRGHTAVEEGLLGSSVSRDVLAHSLRPVLVVPMPFRAGASSASADRISVHAAR